MLLGSCFLFVGVRHFYLGVRGFNRFVLVSTLFCFCGKGYVYFL